MASGTMLDTALAAEAAFYRAFELGDPEAMMSVWAELPEIRCIHPLGPLLTGPAAIRASWMELFRAQLPRRFEIERVNVVRAGGLAVHTVYETITLPLQRQRFSPLLATNVYRESRGEWRMVLHHASPVGASEAAPTFDVNESNATRH
ncbi:MAG: nuclear transport factor 2 family protein [Gammaproteobacteria bacterium]